MNRELTPWIGILILLLAMLAGCGKSTEGFSIEEMEFDVSIEATSEGKLSCSVEISEINAELFAPSLVLAGDDKFVCSDSETKKEVEQYEPGRFRASGFQFQEGKSFRATFYRSGGEKYEITAELKARDIETPETGTEVAVDQGFFVYFEKNKFDGSDLSFGQEQFFSLGPVNFWVEGDYVKKIGRQQVKLSSYDFLEMPDNMEGDARYEYSDSIELEVKR